MNKVNVAQMRNGILLSHKKNEILPLMTMCMELEVIVLSDINQAERQMPHNLKQMWNLKRWSHRRREFNGV